MPRLERVGCVLYASLQTKTSCSNMPLTLSKSERLIQVDNFNVLTLHIFSLLQAI